MGVSTAYADDTGFTVEETQASTKGIKDYTFGNVGLRYLKGDEVRYIYGATAGID